MPHRMTPTWSSIPIGIKLPAGERGRENSIALRAFFNQDHCLIWLRNNLRNIAL